jgi:hypothetical protein
LPNGQRRTISGRAESEPDGSIIADLVDWRRKFSLTAEDAAFIALRTLLPADAREGVQGEPPGERNDEESAEAEAEASSS